MTKWAPAKSDHGHPRFFTGRYAAGASLALMSPVTSRQPDQARGYEDKVVAELVVGFLNTLEGIHSSENARPWILMELPEASQ